MLIAYRVQHLSLWALAVALLGGLAFPAGALEVWMPETGEVALEELPRDTVEARRRHAYALVGAGQWAGGIRELRVLIRDNPDEVWVPEAQIMLARALMGAGRREKAFEKLTELQQKDLEEPLARRAWSLQRAIARREVERNLDRGMRMYDSLIAVAPDEQEAADLMRAKADAAFRARRWLLAQDEYLTLISFYPRSEWVPYSWYQIARSEWKMARWLGLGLERVTEAERTFEDFARIYPEHEKADDARRLAAEARRERADRKAGVARFYIRGRRRPWAAVPYLEYLAEQMPDTEAGRRAAEELETVRLQLRAPTPGRERPLPLPGVEPADQAAAREDSP